jgi:membrane protease YdiL (CAAX protease family)
LIWICGECGKRNLKSFCGACGAVRSRRKAFYKAPILGWFAFYYFIATLFVGTVMFLILQALGKGVSKYSVDIIFQIENELLFLIWLLGLERAGTMKVSRITGKVPRTDWPQYFLIALCLTYFSLGFIFISTPIVHHLAPAWWRKFFGKPRPRIWTGSEKSIGIGWSLLRLGLIAGFVPVVEELIFRGLILQRMAEKWGWKPAVLCSSALFAFAHNSVAGLPGHFVFGLFMALLYLRTRSLWVPIFCHMLNNLLVERWLWYGNQTQDNPVFKFYMLHSQWMGLVMLIFTIPPLVYWLNQFWPRSKPRMPYAVNRTQTNYQGSKLKRT